MQDKHKKQKGQPADNGDSAGQPSGQLPPPPQYGSEESRPHVPPPNPEQAASASRELSLRQRLRKCREKQVALLNNAENLTCFPACCIGVYLGYLFMGSSIWFFAMLGDITGFLGPIGGLITISAIFLGIWWGFRKAVRHQFDKNYKGAWEIIHRTGALLLVPNDALTTEVVEILEQQPVLKWMAPPRPKSFEDQIEFAACFWQQYTSLHYGASAMIKTSFWPGAFAYIGRHWGCVTCGVLSWALFPLPLALLVLIVMNRIKSCAVAAAICDALMADDLESWNVPTEPAGPSTFIPQQLNPMKQPDPREQDS